MVMLTTAAVQAIREVIQSSAEELIGLRVMVKNSGCSGHQYMMGLAPATEPGDSIYTYDGVKVLVDQESQPLLKGVSIDYVEDLNGSGFKFTNPNATSTCGCGSSFSVEEQPLVNPNSAQCSRKG